MFFIKFVVLLSVFVITSIKEVDGELKQVHIVFRHGDRVNELSGSYPKDPYINQTYYPYSSGDITNLGKEREYKLGQSLRKRYNNFLNQTYIREEIEVSTTDTDRTKMSAQLVTAGLYDPQNTKLEWNKEIRWQPVPYHYLPLHLDKIMSPPYMYCPNYLKEYKSYLKSEEGIKLQQTFKHLFNYITKNTGLKVNSTIQMYGLYFGLTTEKEWGLELPPWTIPVFPKLMSRAVILQYISSTATAKLKQLSGGFFLKKVMGDMNSAITGTLRPPNRKMFLYSAHESNLAFILGTLEIYFPHIPPYGSYIALELHEIDGTFTVRILYQDYSTFEPKPYKIPGCSEFCPIENFLTIMRNNMPVDDDACGVNTGDRGSINKAFKDLLENDMN